MSFNRQTYSYARSPQKLPKLHTRPVAYPLSPQPPQPGASVVPPVPSRAPGQLDPEIEAQFELDHAIPSGLSTSIPLPREALPVNAMSLMGSPRGDGDQTWAPIGSLCYFPTPLTTLSTSQPLRSVAGGGGGGRSGEVSARRRTTSGGDRDDDNGTSQSGLGDSITLAKITPPRPPNWRHNVRKGGPMSSRGERTSGQDFVPEVSGHRALFPASPSSSRETSPSRARSHQVKPSRSMGDLAHDGEGGDQDPRVPPRAPLSNSVTAVTGAVTSSRSPRQVRVVTAVRRGSSSATSAQDSGRRSQRHRRSESTGGSDTSAPSVAGLSGGVTRSLDSHASRPVRRNQQIPRHPGRTDGTGTTGAGGRGRNRSRNSSPTASSAAAASTRGGKDTAPRDLRHPVEPRAGAHGSEPRSPGSLPVLDAFAIREPSTLEVGGDKGPGPVLHIPPVYPPVFHIGNLPADPEPYSHLTSADEFKGGIVSVPSAARLDDNDGTRQSLVLYDTKDPCSQPQQEAANPDIFEHSLTFESRFESGNVARAVQVAPCEYNLWIRPDYNAENSHTQWYYFAVQGMRVGVEYTFKIVNLAKADSAYSRGMRPLMYSKRGATQESVGWVRTGEDISYTSNATRAALDDNYDPGVRGPANGHTMSFKCVFNMYRDTCYFAHCYPYTFSDLQNYLKWLQDDPARRQYVRRRLLCTTLSGVGCPLLTITDFSQPISEIRQRKTIVMTARVHPGESNASWMMKGVIDSLTSASRDARILRKNFVFKLVPMLNPDGVIHGQGRCSLVGVDLNRQWRTPTAAQVPTVNATKNMIRRVHLDREVVLYVDMHGHSRKSNVFMYGCEPKKSGKPGKGTSMKRKTTTSTGGKGKDGTGTVIDRRQPTEKLFPRMLSTVTPDFSFPDCSFVVNKKKKSTARVVMRREFDILNSFTLEASFSGASMGANRGMHFTTQSLESMGRAFCRALALYFCPRPMLAYARDNGNAHLLALIHECNRLVIQDRHPNIDVDKGGKVGKKKKAKRAARSAGSRA